MQKVFAKRADPAGSAAVLPGTASAVDPVCGRTVALTGTTRGQAFAGQSVRFWSDKCQTEFKADPWFYASGNAVKPGKVAAAGVQYTCPMHPQIIRNTPGNCPICGMTLEPVLSSDKPSGGVADFTRRMWISAAYL